LKGIIDAALGQFEEPVFSDIKCSGSFYLHSETESIRKFVENNAFDADIVESRLNDQSRGRSGYIIYQSERRRYWK